MAISKWISSFGNSPSTATAAPTAPASATTTAAGTKEEVVQVSAADEKHFGLENVRRLVDFWDRVREC